MHNHPKSLIIWTLELSKPWRFPKKKSCFFSDQPYLWFINSMYSQMVQKQCSKLIGCSRTLFFISAWTMKTSKTQVCLLFKVRKTIKFCWRISAFSYISWFRSETSEKMACSFSSDVSNTSRQRDLCTIQDRKLFMFA